VGAGILVAGLAATGPSTLLRTNSFLRHDLTIARAFYDV
jgi:hypothetical protein